MYIKPFAVEEWMNEYEDNARYNIAETCVDSVSVDDLFALMDGRMCEFDRGDRLHLNDAGNTLVASQVTKAIEAYL